jgi:hypothetical protein
MEELLRVESCKGEDPWRLAIQVYRNAIRCFTFYTLVLQLPAGQLQPATCTNTQASALERIVRDMCLDDAVTVILSTMLVQWISLYLDVELREFALCQLAEVFPFSSRLQHYSVQHKIKCYP